MGCRQSAAVAAGSGSAATDLDSPDSLWAALAGRDVRLLRGSWLVALAERGGVLPRRQECEEEAYIDVPKLKAIYGSSDAKMMDGRKLTPVFAVSHAWRAKDHPDSGGETLRLLGRALQERMPEYRRQGFADIGVFLDWSSLYQHPRSEAEEESFNRSLAWTSLWYGHARTTVFLATDAAEGGVPYHERGWTTFEFHLSWMAKDSDAGSAWPQVVDLSNLPWGRPPSAAPDAFFPGQALGDKTFADDSDRLKVARSFAQTCRDFFAGAPSLDLRGTRCKDVDAAGLGEVFKLCARLEELDLRGQGALAWLPDSLGQLGALKRLFLNSCVRLAALPESLGCLAALEELFLNGCTGLGALPESLGRLGALQTLVLGGCTGLAALPESLGRVGSLRTLLLSGCVGLGALPESLGRLGALRTLDLRGCTRLPASFPGVEELKQQGCKVLR